MFKNKIGEIYILEQTSDSDASDLSEKQMRPTSWRKKYKFQVQAARGPLMVMLSANVGREFTEVPFILDDSCVLVL